MASPKKSSSKKPASAQATIAKEKAKPGKEPASKAKAAVKPKTEAKSKPAASGIAPKRAEVPAYLKTVPPRPRVEAVDEEPAEAAGKPQKPQVDEEWQKNMREALAAQRQRMMAVVQSTQAHMAEKAGDLADISDRASEGFEDELAVGLMAIEAAQLEDINDAIERIDKGSYGLCLTCKRAIPRKRLEVLPFAKRCLTCEGDAERRQRMVASQSDEEEIE